MGDKHIRYGLVTDVVIIVFVVSFLLASCFVSFQRVSGTSMVPTYHPGDLLIATKTADTGRIDRGTIVVARLIEGDYSGKYYIKRVVALPGDSLKITGGVLYVNHEAYAAGDEPIMDAGCIADEITLTDNEYFLLGDNYNDSNDSRAFGPVTDKEITNIVIARIF